MFNNLKIDLGAESRVRPVAEDFDTLEAYAEVVAATEDLERADMQLSMLQLSMENVEKGQELAAAVADATGDQSVAVAVGAESLRSALSIIGQDKVASIVAGAESLDVGAEGVSDVMKAMWEKTKEIARKVWEYIRNLIAKVINFVKGIFGKAEDTAEVILKLVEKAKKDGRTQLKVTEFSEVVQERLAASFPIILAAGDKELTESEYADSIAVMSSMIKEKTDIPKEAKLEYKFDGTDVETVINLFKTVDENKKMDKTTLTNIHAGVKGILDKVTLLQANDIQYSDELKKIMSDTSLLDNVEDELKDVSTAVVYLSGITEKKIILFVLTVTDDAKDAYNAFANMKLDSDEDKLIENMGQMKTVLSRILSGFNVKTITIDGKVDDEVLRNKSAIVPLELSDALNIAKKLKDASKKLSKKLNDFQKGLDKISKESDKNFDKLSKAIEKVKNRDLAKLLEIIVKIDNKQASIVRDILKVSATSNAVIANSLVRSPIGNVIKESERLWVKS